MWLLLRIEVEEDAKVEEKLDVTPGIYAIGIMLEAWPSRISIELTEDSETIESWPRRCNGEVGDG